MRVLYLIPLLLLTVFLMGQRAHLNPDVTAELVTARSNTDVIFEIDADNDGTESFQILEGGGAIIFEVLETGIFTLGDSAADEDIVLDLAATLNSLDVSSNSGVVQWDFQGLNLITSNLQVDGTTPSVDFDSPDTGGIEASINVTCPTTNDCDMDFLVDSGSDTELSIMRIDTETGGATEVRLGTTGDAAAHVAISEGGVMTFVSTADIDLPDNSVDVADLNDGEMGTTSVLFSAAGSSAAWTAQPAIDCTNCTSIPGGSPALTDITDPAGDTTFTFGDSEEIDWVFSTEQSDKMFLINFNQVDDVDATDTVSVFQMDITSESDDPGDILYGMRIIYENGAANTILDAAIFINNAETTSATMTDAVLITSSGVGSGITTALNVSHVSIDNAIDIGTNNILTGASTISSGELDLLDTMTGKTGNDFDFVTGTKGGTGTCAEWNANGDLVEAASAAACGSGGATSWSNITAPGGDQTLAMDLDTTTFNWLVTTDVAIDAWVFAIDYTNGGDVNVKNLVTIRRDLSGGGPDGDVTTLLKIDNLDTADDVVNGIEITGVGLFDNGINFTTTDVVTTAINAANAGIVTALAVGANAITSADGVTVDFGGNSSSITMPNGATPTTDGTGELALDTTITDHQSLWQYEAGGGLDMTIIAIDTAELPALDNEIVSYDAGTDKWILEAPSGGSTPVREICFDAASLQPIVANDAFGPLEKDAGTNLDIFFRAFNDSTDECVSGKFQAPNDMDTGGTVTYRWWWYPKTASANSACWDFKELGIVGLNESWDQGLTLDALGCHAGDANQDEVLVDSDTDATIPWAQGDMVLFQFCRDGDGTQGTDDLSGDANLLMFCIEIPRT